MANPAASLPAVVAGLLKKHTSGPDTFPELRLSPPMTQNGENGTFQILNTPLRYDKMRSNAAAASWDGLRGVQRLQYATVSTQLRPYESDAVVMTSRQLAALEGQNPDLAVLDTARQLIVESLRGVIADAIMAEMSAFSSGGTIDTTTTSYNLAGDLSAACDTIQIATGMRPNLLAVDRQAVSNLTALNDNVRAYAGAAVGGGSVIALSLASEATLRSYVGDMGLELVVMDRSYIAASGTAGFQWTGNAFLGYCSGGTTPSALKTLSPDADVVRIDSGEISILEGGPGVALVARSQIDCVVPDSDLGLTFTVTY